MKSSWTKLFPFIGLLTMSVCFIVFINYSRVNKETTKKPAKIVKPSKPTTRRPPKETETDEGFTTMFVQSRAPDFMAVMPKNMGPTMRFVETVNDAFYDEYESINLYPSQKDVDSQKLTIVQDAETPDYGATLTAFDATSLDSIPWDADNTTYNQSDILWGVVSIEASKSIFMKTYHQNLAADVSNFTDDPNPQYFSPILGISTSDPTLSAALQLNDAAVTAIGQEAMTHAYDRMVKQAIKQDLAKYTKQLDSMAKDGGRLSKLKNSYSFAGSNEHLIRDVEAQVANTREAKLLKASIAEKAGSGKALTANEKAFQFAADAKEAKPMRKLGKAVAKVLKPVKELLVKLGAKLAKAVSRAIGKVLGKTFTKLLTKMATQAAIAMAPIIAQMVAGYAAVASAPVCPPCAVAGAILAAMSTGLMILDIGCMILSMMLMLILPALFDRGLENGGTCNIPGHSGKPLDQIISDPTAYFMFSNLVPIGGVMDAFGPYVCYEEGGSSYFRRGLTTPPWILDGASSLYRHNIPSDLIARGEKTWWTDNTSSLPRDQWKEAGGIWRKNCEGGTWASSDVDALCNAATYVPKTYTKRSMVPRTLTKRSRVPPTTVKDTYITTYMREIRWRNVRWECGNCGAGETKPLAGCLCYTDCNKYNYTDVAGMQKVFTTSVTTDLHCAAQCNTPVNGGAGPTVTSFMCTDNSCKDGYTIVLGVCWKNCTSNQTDIGALCRDKCTPGVEDEVLGVCWTPCRVWPGSNWQEVGALCRERCGGDTPEDKAGICWGACKPGDVDTGMLCREQCPPGMYDKSGICSTRDSYGRESITPASVKQYDAGYQPPDTPDGYARDYERNGHGKLDICDFADPKMLDRMAQFYYDNAITSATIDDSTGLLTYEYIVLFYGVIASSELSCDVACAIKAVSFEPVTGDKYNEVIGAHYPEDPGNSVSYRRFYFIKKSDDPPGMFSVTGCTHADYTAPDAMVKSTDEGADPITSLPKIFDVRIKSDGSPSFNAAAFTTSLVNVGVGMAADRISGRFGTVGSVAGGVAGGMAGQALSTVISNAMGSPAAGLEITKSVTLSSTGIPFINTNNDSISVNFGPIYEYNASIGVGVVPQINFCEKIITTPLLCTNKYVLRNTIDDYHKQNSGKRIKTVKIIEPRGVAGDSGCYYKWDEVDYNTTTNTEGNVSVETEVLYKYTIADKSTCAFTPTGEFTKDLTKYPIRQYYDSITNTTVYPTRTVMNIPIFKARYIRVLPSASAPDRTLQLSQIAVFDSAGTNIAFGKPTYVTSISAGFTRSSSTLTDGTLVARSGQVNTWQNVNSSPSTSDYAQIDLGQNYDIYSVMYIGRADATNDAYHMGVRIQLFFTVEASAKPIVEKVTTTTNILQSVKFTTPQITPKNPLKPFVLPKPLPAQANLGGAQCPVRCQDKPQVDAFIQAYNTNPANTSKIIKVLKATTASANRCDYEAEVLTADPTSGNKTVSKEHIRQKVDLSGSPVAAAGIVYGRYVRLRPALTGGDGFLRVSQVIVKSPANPAQPIISIGQPVYATSFYKYSGIQNVIELPSPYITQNVPLNTTGRYVRVYASQDLRVADKATFALSYVGVFNGSMNLSTGKSATAISSAAGSAQPASIVNLTGGNIKPYSWSATNNMVWQNNPSPGANRDMDYFEIDLGSVQNVTSVKVISRNDYGSDTTGSGSIVSGGDRTTGIRVAVLMTRTDPLIYQSTSARNSAPTSKTVDAAGDYDTRVLPNIWQNSSEVNRATDYWELDLGSIQQIDSINYYPGAIKTTTGVRVQVFTENGLNAVPTYDSPITSDAAPSNMISFNKCAYKFSNPAAGDANMMGDFIQDNTPLLSAIDTKEGVFTFQNIGKSIVNMITNIVTPLSKSDPMGVLKENAVKADNTAKNILGAVAGNQKLDGCPNLKCSDPSILSAIMMGYNTTRGAPVEEEFGIKSSNMKQILKAATSGPNTCDIVFNELYTSYEDYLYPPTESITNIKAMRFTLENTGNCKFKLATGSTAMKDISLNEVTIGTRDSILGSVFKDTQCQLDCRNPAYIASIKQKLSQSDTPSKSQTFTKISQSIATGQTTCEYAMTKNVATQDPVLRRFSTEPNIETFVKATFTVDTTACAYTVQNVTEYDPSIITSDTLGGSGNEKYYMNGVAINLPYLYNYDNTVTGSRVDETVKILS